MKLGIIKHERCCEPTYDKTLVWLPDEMTEDEFTAAVDAARAEYLAFAQAFKNAPPPNDYNGHMSIPYHKYPTLTVAQVEAEWDVKRAAWQTWDAERKKAKRSFGNYIEGRAGIQRFWEYDAPFTRDCDWGHNHGIKLDYDETPFD